MLLQLLSASLAFFIKMADDKLASSVSQLAIIAKSIGYECSQSVLTRADGSAAFKQGTTEVLTAVYGPGEVRMNKEQIDKATIECIFKPKSGIGGCAVKVYERLIRNSCDSIILSSYHPRAAISIIVQVVNDSGFLLSTALNSAFLALLNAGISLKCMAGAISCFLMQDGKIKFDLCEEDDEENVATLTFVFDSLKRNVIATHTHGSYTIEQYFKCLEASRDAVKAVFEFQRKSVERFLSTERRE